MHAPAIRANRSGPLQTVGLTGHLSRFTLPAVSKCYKCESENLDVREIEVPTGVGSYVVLDRSMRSDTCLECGSWTISYQDLCIAEARAALVLFAEVKPPTGEMLKFARKVLGLKRDELAERFGVEAERVRQWEQATDGDPIVALALEGLVRQQLYPVPALDRLSLSSNEPSE